jgi:hypothetical protein
MTVPFALTTSISYARPTAAKRPPGLVKLSVGRSDATFVSRGPRSVGAATFSVEPSGLTAAVVGSTPVGDSKVSDVPEQAATLSAHTAVQASMVFLCIKQILLMDPQNHPA